jgi:hypothetical protein
MSAHEIDSPLEVFLPSNMSIFDRKKISLNVRGRELGIKRRTAAIIASLFLVSATVSVNMSGIFDGDREDEADAVTCIENFNLVPAPVEDWVDAPLPTSSNGVDIMQDAEGNPFVVLQVECADDAEGEVGVDGTLASDPVEKG